MQVIKNVAVKMWQNFTIFFRGSEQMVVELGRNRVGSGSVNLEMDSWYKKRNLVFIRSLYDHF